MSFISIPASWIQVGMAITQRLWQRTKDNLDSLLGQIGTLEGDNIINGSFEVVEDILATPLRPLSWDITEYLGGTAELDDTGSARGQYALKFIHPGGAGNGGGEAKSDYHPLNVAHINNMLQATYYSSLAGVHIQVKVEYFTAAKLFISTETLFNLSGGVPTSKTINAWQLTVSATARFMKVYLIGGVTDVDPGASANIFFDDIKFVATVKNSIDQEAMADDSVGQNELKTGLNNTISVPGAGVRLNVVMDDYAFFPNVHSTSAEFSIDTQIATSTGTTPRFSILNSAGSPRTFTIRWRYITASEGPRFGVFRDDQDKIKCLTDYDDAPPSWKDRCDAMAEANGWTWKEVTEEEYSSSPLHES